MADIFWKLLVLFQLLQENTVQKEEKVEGQISVDSLHFF